MKAEQKPGTDHIHILVVDDDDAIRQLVQRGTQESGYAHSGAASGEDALEKLKTLPVDVVITDIVMPGMTGIELTRIIRETYDADVIVMTGFAENYTYEKIIETGASDFIQKPFHLRELMIRLKRVLRERALFSAKDAAVAQLKKSLSGTVQVIVAMVEKRDPYTAGHQQRVAQLACAIAKEMNLADDIVEGIGMAGIIHDLGKIAIPAEILSKPTPLTDEEFSLIKLHPRAGYDILKDIEFPWPVAQIAFQHHERMDGSGYPQGLKGDEILLEAGIMAVADTVEAMASHRPYRPALGLDAALEEIKKGKGTLYDAKVVDACVRLFSENRFQFDTGVKDPP
ncbi:MAG: response regulator [Desulfotignum sp.]|nr:response regulator [Desulfotignum sp.]MCF8090380.1 response regulator [Desulfotignum sp.]MCF8138693.1 response regulator [Desulfotignum sp.]